MTSSADNETSPALAARRSALDRGAPRLRTRRSLRQRVRLPLMLFGPILVLLAAFYWYLTSGRYMATGDAFIEAARVAISTDIPGRITAVAVRNNQRVKRGQTLFRLDPRPFQIAVEAAQAKLASARLNLEALKATYREKVADEKATEASLAYLQRQFGREKRLFATGAASGEQLDQAQRAYEVARQNLAANQHDIANVLASLGGNPDLPINEHPTVAAAQAGLDRALLNLSYTAVRAPQSGILTKVDELQVGDYVNASTPLFYLMSDRRLWVTANFKETALTHMRPGQKAWVEVDAYPGMTFPAAVESLSPGTGLTFSLLPAENATGNWVKVVQRLPVRLRLLKSDPAGLPLHAGLSVTAEVDTGYRRPLLVWLDRVFSSFLGSQSSRAQTAKAEQK
jgi:membrane fusion protein, multidrug efflux system